MSTRKKGKKASGEKMYSYDEYRREFGVVPSPEPTYSTTDPRGFGAKLAQEAMKKVREEVDKK
jgi:hypothetical protein